MSQATLQHRDHAPTSPGERSGVPAVAVPFAAIVLAMLPAVLDQTILATALPVDRGRPREPQRRLLGRHRLRRRRRGDRRRCGASSATATGASCCSRSRSRSSSPPRRCAARRRTSRSSSSCALVQGAAAGGLMTMAMATVGDLVAPRERGRYQGYIAATFAVATIVGPAHRRRPRRSRELALGLPRQPADRRRRARRAAPAPAGAGGRGRRPAARRVGRRAARGRDERADADLHLGRSALRLGLGEILGLIAATVVLSGGAGRARAARRRPDRPLPPAAHRAGGHRQRRAVPRDRRAVLGHRLRAAVPGDDDGRQPDPGRAAARAGHARHRRLDDALGARIVRTGRYKRFPIAGLALMTVALVLLAAFAGDPSQVATGIALGVFGLGFGMVTQVLIVAVQNSVDRRELGVATATTGFFRALGGAVGRRRARRRVRGAGRRARAERPRCAARRRHRRRPGRLPGRRSARRAGARSSCCALPELPLQTTDRKS